MFVTVEGSEEVSRGALLGFSVVFEVGSAVSAVRVVDVLLPQISAGK